MPKIKIDLRLAAALLLAAGVTACGSSTSTPDDTAMDGGDAMQGEKIALGGNVALTGAGASFPAPLYQNWFISMNKEVPELQVNYQSVGSGAGVEQFLAETVDFGASDVAMKDDEIAQAKRGAILLPMTAGSIVFAYNLPGVENLKLSRDAYVGITTGKITTWNDPVIAADNAGVDLPSTPITFVHRSDGSGTTAVFTKNMSAISPDFEQAIGEGKSVEWPKTGNFIGAKGNEGVTAQIQQTEGSIGYIEYGYAKQNNVPFATIQNKAGNFVMADDETAAATLANVELPENLRAFVVDDDGADSYPFVTYTWMLAYKDYPDAQKAKAMEVMIEYGLNQGQEEASALGYVPLPKNVRERVAAAADVISPDYTIKVK
ncbi:phosphate ABC transporter substrate-binding protein PstS [Nodosilinea nodulosa]|uniref:phosphate ABC transporter substrate-binding protein PstS n=1 Tax=Nodosilinea nodulosa TaxID=416001 RepID=UPI000364FA4C|nr:phosphate ABC transporter substrate-binding protein PstS [Nodosilinea nodulosa]